MIFKKKLLILLTAVGICSSAAFAETPTVGIVNFTTCILESKHGKHEQSQLENIKSQWTSLIEETEKELKDIAAKMEDEDYRDGLSPEAEEELTMKYRALNEDMAKYQNQLYQILNQANYHFVQKMQKYIASASEQVAKEKKLNMVLNKEACFYNKPDLDVTTIVIKKMNNQFDKDMKKNRKVSENETTEAKTDEVKE